MRVQVRWVKTANISSSAGKKINITLGMLLTSDEQTVDIIANAYDADGSSSFTFENTWLDPYEMTF